MPAAAVAIRTPAISGMSGTLFGASGDTAGIATTPHESAWPGGPGHGNQGQTLKAGQSPRQARARTPASSGYFFSGATGSDGLAAVSVAAGRRSMLAPSPSLATTS